MTMYRVESRVKAKGHPDRLVLHGEYGRLIDAREKLTRYAAPASNVGDAVKRLVRHEMRPHVIVQTDFDVLVRIIELGPRGGAGDVLESQKTRVRVNP